MKFLDIQPIPNEPILYHNKEKIIIVADLHIGIESELREYGLNTSSQIDILTNHLVSICDKYKPREIILLGDIKHNIPSSTIIERKEIKKFLEILKDFGIIHIIPGNHDGNIHKIIPKDVIIHPSHGMVYKDVGFVHGHRWPSEKIMQCKLIIIGHTHPTIMLTDRLGYKTFEPCWLKGNCLKNKLMEKYPKSSNVKILVMPAFNTLCGGIAVNQDGIAGPIGKLIDINNTEVYLLDGSSLGLIGKI